MKHIIKGTFFVLIIFSAIVIAAPFLVSTETVRRGIISKIEQLTGHKVTFQGDPSLSFSPFLGFEISDLELIDPNLPAEAKALLKVEKVKAQLDLFPTLLGKVEITQYQFLRPSLFLKTNGDGTKNWSFEKGSLKETIAIAIENRTNQKEAAFPEIKIGTLEIKDGIVIYEDEVSGKSDTITSLNGKVSWPDNHSDADIVGNGIWRGEGITTSATIQNPIEIISSGESNLFVELNSQPVTFTFDGSANMLANLFVKGNFEANTPSINRLAEVIELDVGDLNSTEEWNVQGVLEATALNTNLSEATISIGENTATGVIRFSTDEADQSKLDGTLAFENIDLVNYFKTLGLAGSQINTPQISDNFNVDLRISSQTINIGEINMEKVAAAIIIDNEGWTFDIGDATAFNGKLVAKLGKRLADKKEQAFLDVSATNMDSESISNLLGEKLIDISGKTTFTASVRTNQLEDGLVNSGLNGSISGKFLEGEVKGINLIELFPPEEPDTPANIIGFDENTSTPYDTIEFKLFSNNSVASLSQTSLETGNLKMQLIGEINIFKGTMDLQLQQVTKEGPKEKRYLIQGNTANPLVSLKSKPPQANQN